LQPTHCDWNPWLWILFYFFNDPSILSIHVNFILTLKSGNTNQRSVFSALVNHLDNLDTPLFCFKRTQGLVNEHQNLLLCNFPSSYSDMEESILTLLFAHLFAYPSLLNKVVLCCTFCEIELRSHYDSDHAAVKSDLWLTNRPHSFGEHPTDSNAKVNQLYGID